jgi:hypothetical protein
MIIQVALQNKSMMPLNLSMTLLVPSQKLEYLEIVGIKSTVVLSTISKQISHHRNLNDQIRILFTNSG